ncbi:MAG: hypothetical protein AB7H48_02565 [Parachlamydiales bacterium]
MEVYSKLQSEWTNNILLAGKAAAPKDSSTPLIGVVAHLITDAFHGLVSFKKDLDGVLNSFLFHSTSPTTRSTTEGRTPSTYELSFAASDKLHFGILWDEVRRTAESGKLFELISERRKELSFQKETWRKFIEKTRQIENPSLYDSIDKVVKEGKFSRVDAGCGSAYFLFDAEGKPRYVIKPVDEDILCLNNRKGFGSPFNDEEHLVRDGIPLYRSAQTDAFCSTLATLCGIGSITPKTVMHLISSENYYDISSLLQGEEQEKFFSLTGFPDREKLCSVQEFVQDSDDLYEILHELSQKNADFLEAFDQKDIEEASLFTWLTGDTDAHAGNFRAYVKSVDAHGKPIYGLKKIDNGLSFAEKNDGLYSMLQYLPNAERPLSKETIEKIRSIPMEQILRKMDDYQLGNTKAAFIERVSVVQQLAEREGITIEEIYVRLNLLGRTDGKTLALSSRSLSELKNILYGITDDLFPTTTYHIEA